MASDPPNTGAAFTYSLELDVIKIEDLYTGTKRVADDIKSVLRKIESWHQGPIIGYRIMYLESNGLSFSMMPAKVSSGTIFCVRQLRCFIPPPLLPRSRASLAKTMG